jgi:hypothetical protein
MHDDTLCIVAILQARIPEAHHAKLAAHAQANDRSMAAEVRRMTRMYLAMIERQGAPPATIAAAGNGYVTPQSVGAPET